MSGNSSSFVLSETIRVFPSPSMLAIIGAGVFGSVEGGCSADASFCSVIGLLTGTLADSSLEYELEEFGISGSI